MADLEEHKRILAERRAMPEEEQLRRMAPPGPTLAGMAASAAKAAIGFVAGGARVAPAEVQAERKRTCAACPKLDPCRDRCTICGCVLMDAKRAIPSERCPDDPPRWEAQP